MEWLNEKNKDSDYDLLLDDMIAELQEIKAAGNRPPLFVARQNNASNIINFTSLNADYGFMVHVATNATTQLNKIMRNR